MGVVGCCAGTYGVVRKATLERGTCDTDKVVIKIFKLNERSQEEYEIKQRDITPLWTAFMADKGVQNEIHAIGRRVGHCVPVHRVSIKPLGIIMECMEGGSLSKVIRTQPVGWPVRAAAIEKRLSRSACSTVHPEGS